METITVIGRQPGHGPWPVAPGVPPIPPPIGVGIPGDFKPGTTIPWRKPPNEPSESDEAVTDDGTGEWVAGMLVVGRQMTRREVEVAYSTLISRAGADQARMVRNIYEALGPNVALAEEQVLVIAKRPARSAAFIKALGVLAAADLLTALIEAPGGDPRKVIAGWPIEPIPFTFAPSGWKDFKVEVDWKRTNLAHPVGERVFPDWEMIPNVDWDPVPLSTGWKVGTFLAPGEEWNFEQDTRRNRQRRWGVRVTPNEVVSPEYPDYQVVPIPRRWPDDIPSPRTNPRRNPQRNPSANPSQSPRHQPGQQPRRGEEKDPGVEPDLNYIPRTRFSIGVSSNFELSVEMVTARASARAQARATKEARTPRRDSKSRSMEMYLGALRVINKAWGPVSEGIDFVNAVQQNITMAKPINILGSNGKWLLVRPDQALRQVPFSHKLGYLRAMYENPALIDFDVDGLITDVITMQLMDGVVGMTGQIEERVLRQHFGPDHPLRNWYGNPSTWASRWSKQIGG